MSTNQTNVNSFNRARRDYHAVGKCIPKKDSSQLLLGKPVFTDDITPRDALVIKLLRSPYANAIVEDVKTDIALKVPGMVAVYTWEDVPKKRFSIAGQTFPEPSPYDRLILDRHVRSVGDAVAIVVGESEKAVDKALNMIKVKYTILEPVLDFRKSLDNKVLVHPEDDWSSSINTGDVKRNLIHHEEDEHGNVEKILSECDEIIEHTYRIKAAQQAYMETCRAYCEIDRYGRLHCISSTQIVFHLRRILSNALDIPKSMVRAEKPRIGGGFGAKQTAVCEVYPAFVTWKTKRPSKIIYSRKECQTIASPRHEMEVTVRLGAMRDGHIRAIDLYTLSNGGAYGEHSTTTVGLSGHKSLPLYTGGCEATRFSCDVVYTNVQAAGAYRGYGATQGIFALESTVNELAEKLHIDPVELRLKNIVREGMFMPAYFGETANACALDRCIMHCADNFHWADKYPVRDMGNGKVRAAGMALAMQGSCISNVDVGSCTLKLSDCARTDTCSLNEIIRTVIRIQMSAHDCCLAKISATYHGRYKRKPTASQLSHTVDSSVIHCLLYAQRSHVCVLTHARPQPPRGATATRIAEFSVCSTAWTVHERFIGRSSASKDGLRASDMTWRRDIRRRSPYLSDVYLRNKCRYTIAVRLAMSFLRYAAYRTADFRRSSSTGQWSAQVRPTK